MHLGRPQSKVNNQMMTFKLDTGAEVTALTEPAFLNQPLKDRAPSPSSKEKTCIHNAFLVRDLEQNLLGLPAIQDLNLLAKVAEVRLGPDDLVDITAQFPALFSGLGTLKDESHICLKPAFALHTPRNVPLPLHKKVKEELARMESLGVISKINVPTPWRAGMVLGPTKDGTVRICLDLTPPSSVNPILCPRSMTLSPSCQEPRYSASWMPIVGFGRGHVT